MGSQAIGKLYSVDFLRERMDYDAAREASSGHGIIGWFCVALLRLFRNRTEIIYVDGSPYLMRVHIVNQIWFLPAIYLHYFFKGDEDRSLHDHPWAWAASLVLTGGYTEERCNGLSEPLPPVEIRERRPGSFSKLSYWDVHRVSLTENGCWTLFFAGRHIGMWGFVDRVTGNWTEHSEYGETGFRYPLMPGRNLEDFTRGS